MSNKTAILSIDGIKDSIELPVLEGNIGPNVIDVGGLTAKGYFTYDPGFMSTASFKYTSIMFRAAAVAFSVGPCMMWERALSVRYLKYHAAVICRLLWAGALGGQCDVSCQSDEASAYCFRPGTRIFPNHGVLP